MNWWDDAERAAYLATTLKWSALKVLANHHRQDCRVLDAAVDNRFGGSPSAEISKVKLKNWVKQREAWRPPWTGWGYRKACSADLRGCPINTSWHTGTRSWVCWLTMVYVCVSIKNDLKLCTELRSQD
jgi:hypothetical protein